MRHLLKTAFLVWLVSLSMFAFADRNLPKIDSLSESSYISLLTCDPGPELYATFGHSAIGVVDPEQNLMLVFNYGTFSFNVPFFYAKFASGKLMYRLSFTSYVRFLREYQYDHRRVVEQKLNLTRDQRQRLFDALQENYKPENREYQYDFFFDNCATRITDMFHKVLGDSLQHIPEAHQIPRTFRNMIDEYLTNSYWSDFGIDLALGAVIDRDATEMEKTFLPDYLSAYVERCEINGKPFVTGERALVKDTAEFPPTPLFVRPNFVFWILFLIICLLTVFFRSKSWIIGDRIIFGAIGFVGLIVFLMWVATDHDATANNLNVLWANPLYLVFVWFIGGKRHQLVKWASSTTLALNLFVLLGWSIIPQQYNTAFIPLIGIMTIRSGLMALRSWRYS